MLSADTTLDEAHAVALRLAGSGAKIHRLNSDGRNSRIYRVVRDGVCFALKQYPTKEFDPRDRLRTEVGALRLMEQTGIDTVPRVVAADAEAGYLLLTWIEGTAVTALTDRDIDAAAAFLATIHALKRKPWAAEQPTAAEACLSGAEIERQLSARRATLQKVAAGEPELSDFLDKSFDPVYQTGIARAKVDLGAAHLDFAAKLPQEQRSLVPSDFGFHNSLRRADGSLAFFDFEYFGWDDPVKMTADMLLHPAHSLAARERHRFRQAALAVYGEDADFAVRLDALLPLFGLRWVLIMLNEFIPERWRNRVLAGTAQSWTEAKSRQLDRARLFLASLAGKVQD
jgi:hypothetical protein